MDIAKQVKIKLKERMVTKGENKGQLSSDGSLDKYLTNMVVFLSTPSKSTMQIFYINKLSNRLIKAVQIQVPMLVYIPKAWKPATLRKPSQRIM